MRTTWNCRQSERRRGDKPAGDRPPTRRRAATGTLATLAAAFLTGVTLAVPAAHAAPPPNDAFADAIVAAGESGSIAGTNAEATKEPGEGAHAGDAGGHSVWYRWTAPYSGVAQIDTCESALDTLLAVYVGTAVSALTEVAAADDGCGVASRVVASVSAGTEYRIAVDGYEGEVGAFTLRWSRVQRPAYDDFAASRPLEGARGRLEGTNFGATLEPQEPRHAGGVGATVWFAWTAPISGLATVETCGSTFDTVLAVYTGDALAQLALVGANDDACGVASRVQFPVQAGARFRVVLDGLTRMGDFVLSWSFPPANDARAAARAVTGVRGSQAGTSVGATKEAGEPDHARFRGGASVWYRWRAPKTFRVAFATCGAPFDTVLAVYRRTGTRLAAVVANDDGCRSGAGSLAAFSAVARATYLIALDGIGGGVGTFVLTWGTPPAWAARCVVPTVRSTVLAQARRLIAAANCSVGRVSRVRSSIVPRGRVVTQFPEPGTRLRNGSKVHMEVSSGRRG